MIIIIIKKKKKNNNNNNNNNNLYYALLMYMVKHSRKFNYITRYFECNENNVQARKLNEPVGFLVGSLNNLGSR